MCFNKFSNPFSEFAIPSKIAEICSCVKSIFYEFKFCNTKIAIFGLYTLFKTVSNYPPNTLTGVLAKGGKKGINNTNNNFVNKGEASLGVGEIRFSGGNGLGGTSNSGQAGGSSAGYLIDGNNASSINSTTAPEGGGNGGAGSSSSNGQAGIEPGGGGGGSDDHFSRFGGNGGNGKVIISYFLDCNGMPNDGIIEINNVLGCANTPIVLTTSNLSLERGISYIWQQSIDSISWDNIFEASNDTLIINPSSNIYFRIKSFCLFSNLESTSIPVYYSVLPIPVDPEISFTGNTVFCDGDSIILYSYADSSLTYQWKKDFNSLVGETNYNITVSLSGVYFVEITNNYGCKSYSDSVTIIVNSRPNIFLSNSGSTTFCQGDSVLISATNEIGLTYQWLNNGVNILGANTAYYTVFNTGVYSVVVSNSFGCSYTPLSTNVTVVSYPNATIDSQGIFSICQGGTVLLTANSGSGLTYQWVNNGTNISEATSSTYSATSEGTYTVIVTNADLCSITSNSLILTFNQLTTSISPLTTSMNTGYVTSAGSKTTGSMQVSTSSTYGRGWAKFPLSSIPVGSIITSVVIKFYTYGGTSSTTSNTIRGFTGDPVTMTGSTLYNTIGSGTIYNTSTWTIGTTTAPVVNLKALSAAGVTFVQNQLSTGYVNFGFVGGSTSLQSIYGNNNSTYGVRLEIAYNPPPPPATINVSGNTTFCQGNTLNLTSNSSVGYSYQWKNNGTNILGANSSSYAASSSGNYTVQVTNTSGCVTISNGTAITVNPLPNVTLTNLGPLSFCQGGSVILNANSNDTAFQWKKNGVNISGATSSTYTANSAGSYTVTVINSFGCSNSSNSVNVIVNSLPNPNISGSTSICQGDTSVLSINSNTGITYQWLNNGQNINGATNYYYPVTSPGSYSVFVTNVNGCLATSTSVSVTVNQLPTSTISALNATSFCQGGSTYLIADNNVGLSYQWYKNDFPIIGSNSSNYEATTSGNYYVYLFDNFGCSNISDNEIQVVAYTNPYPYLIVSGDTSICIGETTSLMAVSNGNVTWNGSFNQNSIEVQPSSTSTYIVSAIDSNNCITSRQIIVEVNFPNDKTIYTSSYGPFVLNGQVYQESGVYTQNLQTVAGCDSILTIHLNYIANSLLELKDFGIVLYPNPSKDGIIYINSSNEFYIGEIIILNSLGLVVDRLMYKDVLDLSNLANGMYWIQFNIEGNTFYEKIIKG